jgi:hypothetical protein
MPRALLAVDRGAATTSVAVLGRPAARWRLLGRLAAPAPVAPDAVAAILAARIADADPELAERVGLRPAGVADLPRLEVHGGPPPRVVVLGGSRRAADLLAASAARTPWRVTAASPETHDPREMTELALDAGVTAVVAGAGDPPGPDERADLDLLAALVTAAGRRRPDLDVILSGALRTRRGVAGLRERDGSGRLLEVGAVRRRPDGVDALREALLDWWPYPSDGRAVTPRALGSLAEVTDRRLALVEVGHDGGLVAWAEPAVDRSRATVRWLASAVGGLVPPDPRPDDVDAILGWTTGSLDRHRLADRLQELRTRPWVDLGASGIRLRLAAARAALERLLAMAPRQVPPSDLLVIAGGVFEPAPPAAAALAVLDVMRRPGSLGLARDAARLLGPLGTIDDAAERRSILADLADDLLLPLGSAITLEVPRIPPGEQAHAPLGHLSLARTASSVDLELVAGDLSIVDLGPGERVAAAIETRAGPGLLRRSRRVTTGVAGGLAGLLVDLRGVPLRRPERRDRRRATLAAWEGVAWPAGER